MIEKKLIGFLRSGGRPPSSVTAIFANVMEHADVERRFVQVPDQDGLVISFNEIHSNELGNLKDRFFSYQGDEVSVSIGEPLMLSYQISAHRFVFGVLPVFKSRLRQLVEDGAFHGFPFAGLEIAQLLENLDMEQTFAEEAASHLQKHSEQLFRSWFRGADLSERARQAVSKLGYLREKPVEDLMLDIGDDTVDVPSSEPVLRPKDLLNQAVKAQRRGDRSAAAALYHELMERFPDFEPAWESFLKQLKAWRSIEEGMMFADRAIEKFPFKWSYRKLAIEFADMQGDRYKADEWTIDLYNRFPEKNDVVFFCLSRILRRNRGRTDAIRIMKDAIREFIYDSRFWVLLFSRMSANEQKWIWEDTELRWQMPQSFYINVAEQLSSTGHSEGAVRLLMWLSGEDPSAQVSLAIVESLLADDKLEDAVRYIKKYRNRFADPVFGARVDHLLSESLAKFS